MTTATTTARRTLDLLLSEWQSLLQSWAASGQLVAAAREALQLAATPAALSELVKQWSAGDFEALPPIVLLPGSSMPGAAGAYANSMGTIYLNADWLRQASAEQSIAVITEELGHHLDGLLNPLDTAGDEGEQFALVLGGWTGTDTESDRAEHIENDTIAIKIGDDTLASAEANWWKPSTTSSLQYGIAVGRGTGVFDIPSSGYFKLRNTIITGSGLSIHFFYTSSTLASVKPLAVAGYSFINQAGQLSANSDPADFLPENIWALDDFYLGGGGGSHLFRGTESNELLWLNPTASTGYSSRALVYIHAGGGNDVAVLPVGYQTITSIESNDIGVTKITTPYADLFLTGVEAIDFIDARLELSGGMAGNALPNFVVNPFGLSGQQGPGSVVNIDNRDNIYFNPQDNLLISGVDFLGGNDFLMAGGMPSTTGQLADIDGKWQIYGNGFSSEYSGLEYIQFSDKAFALAADGTKREIAFVPVTLTPVPVLTMAVSPASVTEDGTANLIYTFSRTGATTSRLTVNYTAGGTATLGTDYTGIATDGTIKTIIFAAGSGTATVTVDPTSDSTIEDDETVALTLAEGNGYTVGTTAAVVGTISNESRINGTGASETLPGTAQFDDIKGLDGDDTIEGLDGDDILEGQGGDDKLDGGPGFDTAQFDLAPGELIIRATGQPGVYSISSALGTDIITGIEQILTNDGSFLIGDSGSGLFSMNRGGENILLTGTIYQGPVATLERQLLGTTAIEIIGGTTLNDFLNLLGGDDAADAGIGDDVLDGGAGSNFLTGGVGKDVFFLDGRAGTVTWSTITDWEQGEQLSVWGWKPGVSKATFVQSDGAQGFKGVTMHGDLNGDGTIDTSVTWANRSQSMIPTPLEFDGLLWFT